MATMFARMLKAGTLHALPKAGMHACPMLLSALLLEGAGQAIASLKPVHASPASKIPGSSRQKVHVLPVCLLYCMLSWCCTILDLPARAHLVLLLHMTATWCIAGCQTREHQIEAVAWRQQTAGWLQYHQRLKIPHLAHRVHHAQHHDILHDVL